MNKNTLSKNIVIVLTFIFLYAPIIVLVIYSFNKSKMNVIWTGFTLDWYKRLFENTDLLEAFRNTLLIAGISTITSTIIGTISALGLYKYNFPLKKLVNRLIYIPIVIPEIVLGISLLSVFTMANLKLGLVSIIISHIAFSIPFVITSVRSTLNLLPKEYEEVLKYYDPYEFVDWFINKNISKNVQLKVYKNLIKFLLEKLKYYGIDPFLLYEKHNFFGEEYKEKYIEFLDYIGYYKSIKNKIDKTVNKEENKEEDNLVIIDIQQKKNNKEITHENIYERF